MRVGKAKRERRQRRLARRAAYAGRSSFLDEYFATYFDDSEGIARLFRNQNHLSCTMQRHGLAKPWCCAFHAGGGNPHAYCAGGPPPPEPSVIVEQVAVALGEAIDGMLSNVGIDEMRLYTEALDKAIAEQRARALSAAEKLPGDG